MSNNNRNSEAELIEKYRVTLDNIGAQPEVASAMAELGYDAKVIAEGKSIWQETYDIYLLNKKEDIETTEAYSEFFKKKEELAEIYSMHRKIAKVLFRKDNISILKLGINGSIPQAYVKWMEVVKMLYTEANSNEEIKKKLLRFNITEKDIKDTLSMVLDLEQARNRYVIEKGESQDTTRLKDKSMIVLVDWMTEIYAVLKIALYDRPQLLETLGIFVRS